MNNRKRNDDMPNRSSNMEQAEGSRDTVRNDLGTSSDRAMYSERTSSGDRDSSGDRGRSKRHEGSGSTTERGTGRGGERNSSSGGGISNRSHDREQSEQDELPERGRSRSER